MQVGLCFARSREVADQETLNEALTTLSGRDGLLFVWSRDATANGVLKNTSCLPVYLHCNYSQSSSLPTYELTVTNIEDLQPIVNEADFVAWQHCANYNRNYIENHKLKSRTNLTNDLQLFSNFDNSKFKKK